jgi:hypothetical protein
MRKALTELCVVLVAVAAIHAIRIMHGGIIKGKIYPATKRNLLLAVNGLDSIRALSEQDGYFGLRVKPGTWTLIVENIEPNHRVVREGVEVNEGENINLGIIRLSE